MNSRASRLPRIILIILTIGLMGMMVSRPGVVHAAPILGLDGAASGNHSVLLTTNNNDDIIILITQFCTVTECSNITDSNGLTFTQRYSSSANGISEYYATAAAPLDSDNITLTREFCCVPFFAFAVKGADPITVFDQNPSLPASTACPRPWPNECSISAETSSLDFVIAIVAIGDAGPCSTPPSFAVISNPNGRLELDYAIVDSSASQTTFTCSGTDSIAIVLDALAASSHMPHAPILINGDSGFTTNNGVTGGSGTIQDPYVIGDWEIDGNSGSGIQIRNTDASFVITNVYVHSETNSNTGVIFDNVTNGNLLESRIVGFFIGVGIQAGVNITLTGNSVEYDTQGLFLRGLTNGEINNNIVSNNGVSNLPNDGAAINAAIIIGVDISKNTLHNNGILIGRSSQYSVLGNTIQAGGIDDISVDRSNSFQVGGNQISDDNGRAVVVSDSSSFLVTGNRITAFGRFVPNSGTRSGLVGIYIYSVPLGSATGFDVTNNYIYGNTIGISMDRVSQSTVSNNFLTINGKGAAITSSTNITFLANTFGYNDEGFTLNATQNMLVYHNNFEGPTPLATDTGGSNNSWDNGYPDGGNYWTDFSGTDNCSGPNQDMCSIPDGIGDTPYVFNYNQDNYPLMRPFTG